MAMVVQMRPMLARRLLRLAVVDALQRAKVANSFDWTIDSPGDWPTEGLELTVGHARILVRCGQDDKANADRNATMGVPKFNTDVEIEIEARLQAPDEISAQDSLEALAYTVENLVLTDKPLGDVVQAYKQVRTRSEISAEGRQHLAGFFMTLVLEVYEEFDASVLPPPESSWPVAPNPIVPLETIGLQMDLRNVFDPWGTYFGAPDPDSVVPAPRTAGPDGRIEAGLLLENLNYLGPGALDDSGDYTGFMLDISTLE
ncbi:MAG TPA: hypothetical protein VFA75_03150 [Nevskia sp.]|nr:hypothetical protein [Nevskia sp.]